MKLRAGIVGCGGISRSHAAAYDGLDNIELIAVCDINTNALNNRADEFNVQNRYTDYTEMLSQEYLDIVSVCTHAPLHAPITIAAAENGVHVLCEKPLSVDLVTADQMLKACNDAQVHLTVSHQFRFTPLFRHAKTLVESGKIGELRSIREVGKGREAGFELMEMGVHYFDEMDFFMNGISWIQAHITYNRHDVTDTDIMHSSKLCTTDRRDNGIVAGDTMLIHIGGSSGAYGIMELYPREQRHGWMMGPHLLGSNGQLMIKPNPNTGIDELWFCPFDVSFAQHTPEWEQIELDSSEFIISGKAWKSRHTIWSAMNIRDAILNGTQPKLGGQNALTSLECVSATYTSHFTNQKVQLPLAERYHPLIKRLNTGAQN